MSWKRTKLSVNESDYEGDLFTRQTDPAESHQAAAKVDVGWDRQECFFRFAELIEDEGYYATRTVFQFDFLIDKGYTPIRAKSICRRLSDIVMRENNPFPETLWLLCPTGERVNGSAILTFRERGRLVLQDPGIMTGLWGQTKPRKKKKPKDPK